MDEQQIKKELERDLYLQAFESTQKYIKEKRDKLSQEYHQKGQHESGAHATAVVKLELEGLKILISSYFDILKRIYFETKYFNEKFLKAKIEELYHARNQASKQSLSDYLPWLGSRDRHIADFEWRSSAILSQVLRDVRIATLEGSLEPKKSQEEAEKQQKESLMITKEKRKQFLLKLNELSEGDIRKFIDTMSIGDALGFDRATAFSCARYFYQKRYIEPRDDAYGTISITAAGIDEADRIQPETVTPSLDLGNDVFIVHGHDAEAKLSAARFIEKLGLKAIILHEIPNIGRTIIEKFEDHSNVGYAVVLLTPDDLGAHKDKKEEWRHRARQNVILELGYFIGKLGRKRVCVLYKEDVEIPSDYQGILYIEMDRGDGWQQKLAREMKEVGLKIDPAKLL